MNNKRKKVENFLRKYNLYVQAIFVIITTIVSGIFTNSISNIMFEKKMMFIGAFKNMGIGNITLLIVYIFLFSIYIKFQDYIKKYPDKSIMKKRDTIINGLLESITKALFMVKYKELEVSAVIQLCKKRERKVAFNYNTITNNILVKKIPLYFGDVGTTCVKEKEFLIKDYTYADWNAKSQDYHRIVPKDLRLIIAQPICNTEKVIAVLEFDVFETTRESKRNSSKVGYLTDTISIKDIMSSLNNRRFRKMLDKLSEAFSLLIDD